MPHDIIEPEQTMLDELSDTGRAAVAAAVRLVRAEIAAENMASEKRVLEGVKQVLREEGPPILRNELQTFFKPFVDIVKYAGSLFPKDKK